MKKTLALAFVLGIAWRLTHGASPEQAVAEWTQSGYGFHQAFEHLVKFFRELDFEHIKREAGLPVE